MSHHLMQVRYKRAVPSGWPPEDEMVNTVHFNDNGATITTTELEAVADGWESYLTTIATGFTDKISVDEIRFYELPVSPGPMGAPTYVHPGTFVGTNAATLQHPYQVSVTVTLQTALRRHWGRVYLPCVSENAGSFGRLSSAFTDLLVSGMVTWVGVALSNSLVVETFSRATWTGLDVIAISADDIYDVQRRRRTASGHYRKETSL